MNTINISPRPGDARVVRCRPPAVYVDGERRRDLTVLQWELLGPPTFSRVVLTTVGTPAGRPPARFGDIHRLPPVGALVRVCCVPAGGAQFTGTVVSQRQAAGPRGERIIAECTDVLAGGFDGKLTDHWRSVGGDAVKIERGPVRFNAGRGDLASAARATINGRSCKVFDSAQNASGWTVAEALEYLLACYAPAGVEIPSNDELEALAGGIDLGTIDATGKTAGEVLLAVLDRGGLHMRAGRSGESLWVYRPPADGRRRAVRLQPVGRQLDTSDTNLWRGRVAFTRRPSRRGVLAIGARKQYEATFELLRGWDPDAATGRWRDFTRSLSDNWPQAASVFRWWVLNEHGWYSGSPWQLPVYDFSALSEDDFTTRSPRRFLPCLSSDALGRSLGIVVQFRCSPDGQWRPWAGPVWTAADQCAIYLGGDSLPADYFQAAVASTAEVRVTCVVQADARLTAERRGDPHQPKEVIDVSARASWRQIDDSSILKQATGLGEPDERDDTKAIEAIAARQVEAASLATEAELTLGWIDTSFQVGDVVEQIDGRDLQLSTNSDTRPFVRSILHDFGQAQTTRLVVRG